MNVTATPPRAPNAELEFGITAASPHVPLSDAALLAALLVETEDQQAAQHRQDLTSARERVQGAIEREYQALLESADAAWAGALAGGVCTIAGGAAGVGAALGGSATPSEAADASKSEAADASKSEACSPGCSDALGPAGNALLQLSGPLDVLVGQSTATRFEAEARLARGAAEDAKFDAEQSVADAGHADRRSEQALEFARAMAEAEARADEAVLANF